MLLKELTLAEGYSFQTFDKSEWEAEAKSLGYETEPADGKLIAHLDGDEKGMWDPKYGGSGFGWFFK